MEEQTFLYLVSVQDYRMPTSLFIVKAKNHREAKEVVLDNFYRRYNYPLGGRQIFANKIRFRNKYNATCLVGY